MTRFTIEVEIDGDRQEASRALVVALDSDVLQNHIGSSGAVSLESTTVTEETEVTETLTRFTVEAVISGNRSEAAEALDDALDAGVLQDAIGEHGAVTVETAVVVLEQAVRR